MTIYFIQAGSGGPVKIGHAFDVHKRMIAMQSHNHEKLRLIRTIEGGAKATENMLHRTFLANRTRGEWFSFCDTMLTIQPPGEQFVEFASDVARTPERRHRVRDIIKRCGGQASLGDSLGISRAAVNAWIANGRIPYLRLAAVAKILGWSFDKFDAIHRMERPMPGKRVGAIEHLFASGGRSRK